MLDVRLYGHVSASFGLGDGAAATRRSLEACGCRVHCVDLKLATHQALAPDPATSSQPDQAPAGVLLDLVHTNPNVLAATPGLLAPGRLTAPLRIGYWAWELEAFPDGWELHFGDYDEIWCPSAYCAQSLSQRSSVPVIPLPHLPDWSRLDRLQRQRQGQQQGQRPSTFRFLSLFDFWSTLERKNPAGVIAAFQQAFPPERAHQDPAVELLIKTSSAEQFPRQRRELEALAGGDRRIRWLDGLLSRTELDHVFCSADALVSLHRAEGFGLNLADAMAIELPVIATGYSANLEFMPPGSAELVPWATASINQSCGDYRKGLHWADPNLEAAAAAMARLVQQPAWAAALGRCGAAAVRERLSSERLAAIVRQRLAQVLLQPSRRQLLAGLPHDHDARLLEWSTTSPR